MKNVEIPKEKAKKLIESQFPSLNIEHIKSVGEGWDNVVYMINSEYIFRFPKWDWASESLFRESKLLPIIQTKLSVQIPDFAFIGQASNDFDKYFVGYRPIQGKFLWKDYFYELKESEQEDIYKDLAQFFISLHEIPLELLEEGKLEHWGYKDEYAEYFTMIKHHTFSFLTDLEQKKIKAFFDSFLSDERNFSYTPAVLHSDLSSDHILINGDTKRLSGLIDWGDLRIGDPDYDLYPLYEDYGVDFVRNVLRYYPHNDHEYLMQKLEFFRVCQCFGEVIHDMQDQVDDAYINEVRLRLGWN